VQDEALDQVAPGQLPIRIRAVLDDNKRGLDARRVVDGEIALRIDRIERVVAGLERGRQLHLAVGIENANLLSEPYCVFGAVAAPAGGNRRVLSFGIHRRCRSPARYEHCGRTHPPSSL
jgi:hypothetical protein